MKNKVSYSVGEIYPCDDSDCYTLTINKYNHEDGTSHGACIEIHNANVPELLRIGADIMEILERRSK